MNVNDILIPVLTLGIMGLLFGAILAIASHIFKVEKDERLDKIMEVLPGANCGGCGYAGCSNYASEVISGRAGVDHCSVGGAPVAEKLAEIMGVKVGETVRYVAHVNCRGGIHAEKKYTYSGLQDCISASKLNGGPLACQYGCLGFGTCMKTCPFDAITMKDGVALVTADKCMGCKKCMAACPRGIISLVPYTADVSVSCASRDKGAILTKICNIGCIGCRICEKECPAGAITVEDNLARIDYSKCINCGTCATKCPRKLIINSSEVTTQTKEELA